jgi:hypothetical protein
MQPAKLYRRQQAGDYLREKYGVGSTKSLDKMAVVGGGPAIIYNGRIPLYDEAELDRWALSRLSAPVANTSERKAFRALIASKMEAR